MGHYLLSAEKSFSAAHRLPDVPLCERFHGHNWNVRVTVRVDEEQLDSHGMGVDFRVIEQALSSATAQFDHRYLNDIPPFDRLPPSAENIARLVSERVTKTLDSDYETVCLEEIEVWETPEYRVVYRPQ